MKMHANTQHDGSALILALLMTALMIGYSTYVWYMAACARQISYKHVTAEYYLQATQGVLTYAVGMVSTYFNKLTSGTQDRVLDNEFAITHVPLTIEREVQARVLLEGYKDYVHVHATLLEKEKPRCALSCNVRPVVGRDGKIVRYAIDSWTRHAA